MSGEMEWKSNGSEGQELTENQEYLEFVMDSRQNKTMGRPGCLTRAVYGLTAEVGELNGLMEKAARRGTPLDLDKVEDELGDIMHTLYVVIGEFGFDPDAIIMSNIDKVTKRRKEGYYGEALATTK